VEVIGVTASTGYDTDTVEQSRDEDDKQLPATVTLLVSPEQAKILAELEADGKLHLSLVYRGSKEGAAKFTEFQDKVLEVMHPKPVEQAADQTGQPPVQETADPSAAQPVPENPGHEAGGE
jgi:pilus assembly protein CpaB